VSTQVLAKVLDEYLSSKLLG